VFVRSRLLTKSMHASFMKLCFDQRLVSNFLMLMVPSHTIEIIVNTSFLVKKNI